MSLSRRKFLAVSGIVCSLSVAGCSGPNAGDGIDYGNASVNSETTTPSTETESNSTEITEERTNNSDIEINEEDNGTTTNSSKDGDERDTDANDESAASNVSPEEAMRRVHRAARNNDLETFDRYTINDFSEQGDQASESLDEGNPPEPVVVEEYTAEELKQQLDPDTVEEAVTEMESVVKERESMDDYTFVYTEYTDPYEHEDYHQMFRRDGIWVTDGTFALR